jgi:muramoyltetrapeptide carboxypeptidase
MQPLKPRALRPGDLIGIVSTSSPVTAGELDRLTAYLGGRGYTVRVADGVLDRTGYIAGTAERRAADLLRMFGDPEVSMVMPVTGGIGASHLVDLLDYELIRAHPKLFTGFSNPSVLNNSILAAAALASVHGVSGFQFFQPEVDVQTETAFWRMVSGPIAGQEVTGEDWRVYRADSAAVSGPVVGGNLWMVSALAGSRWMPSTSGAILLLEDLSATFDQVDDVLAQLRLAGVFDDVAALVIGTPADWEAGDAPDASTDELVLRCVRGRFPVITGVGFGHQPAKIQFPIGCRVEFDLRGDRPVLRYLEDLVMLGQ